MIIYEEKKLEPEPKRVTCKKCKSLLGVEKHDIIKISQFDQREGQYYVDGFKCPICQNEQTL